MKPCGARTRAGTPCKRAPMPNGRCSKHGGKSLSGPAAPAWRHGQYSKVIPERLAARYETAQRDPELLSLREDLALIDTRITELLERLQTGDSTERWRALERADRALRAGEAGGDSRRIARRMARLHALIGQGASDAAIWRELYQLINTRRVLAAAESKRLVTLQNMLTLEQATALFARLLGIVKRHITDARVLAAISADVRALLAADGQDGDAH